MKYLIVSGDSNTTWDFDSISHPNMDFSYKKWPELLSEKLGMKVINVAMSAQGNEYIYTTLRDEIIKIKDKSEIGLVIAAWSQAPRKDYKDLKLESFKHDRRKGWRAVRINTHGSLPYWVEKSLGHYLDFQILCERYSLNYVQFQMIELFEHYLEGLLPCQNEIESGANPGIRDKYPGNEKQDEKIILDTIIKYEKNLNISKFIGWPPVKKLGGFRLKDKLDLWTNKQSQNRVSYLDNHPNKLGHIAVCDKINMLLEEYQILKKEK